MSAKKPSIPSGTRDFGPEQVRRRRWMLDTLRGVFERYGYQPLETPAMENLSVLEGKYGEEGDRLLFRILNQGDAFIKWYHDILPNIRSWRNPSNELAIELKHQMGDLHQAKDIYEMTIKLANEYLEENTKFFIEMMAASSEYYKEHGHLIAERGLRYDLTVPFARYVVMHQHELALPFRRYQMQPVWRGDRPQRGRYREFWQCDVDVVGSTSLLYEAEFIQIYDRALTALGLRDFTIRLNHRVLLQGISERIGAGERFSDLTVALDKLDKVGREGVEKELTERGFTAEQVATLGPVFDITGTPEVVLDQLQAWLGGAENPGVSDLRQVLALTATTPLQTAKLAIDLTLARGLNYYTGCIFEVVTHEVAMGSIGGGGRYDNLTAAFGAKDALPGAGVSFGVDRIYDVLEALDRFPAAAEAGTRVLLTHFSAELSAHHFARVTWLRERGVAAELYPEPKKLGKQFEYADKRGLRWAWVEGPDDVASGVVQLKDLVSGTQQALTAEEASALLQG